MNSLNILFTYQWNILWPANKACASSSSLYAWSPIQCKRPQRLPWTFSIYLILSYKPWDLSRRPAQSCKYLQQFTIGQLTIPSHKPRHRWVVDLIIPRSVTARRSPYVRRLNTRHPSNWYRKDQKRQAWEGCRQFCGTWVIASVLHFWTTDGVFETNFSILNLRRINAMSYVLQPAFKSLRVLDLEQKYPKLHKRQLWVILWWLAGWSAVLIGKDALHQRPRFCALAWESIRWSLFRNLSATV